MYPYTFSRKQLAEIDRALEALSTMGILDADEKGRVQSIRRILRNAGASITPDRDWVMVSFSEKDSKIMDKVMEGIW